MSKKQKIAGVDRPYTLIDLAKILHGFIEDGDWEDKACLEDYSPYEPERDDEMQILRETFSFYSITHFGGERIYTTFYIEDSERKWKYRLLTATTLGQSEDAFMKMNEMAGAICYKFHRFVDNNFDNFIWKGFDISYTAQNGKEVPCYWCCSLERVAILANGLRKEHGDMIKVHYVDKSTRKKREYKF